MIPPTMSINASHEIMWWCALLLVLAVVGYLAVLAIRRWQEAGDDAGAAAGPTFALSDLRRLRDEGRLSEQEYDQARAAVIGQTGATPTADDAAELGPELLPDSDPPPSDVDNRPRDDTPPVGGESPSQMS